MIKIENVSFKYKESKMILNNLSFQINEGEIVAIVGKNGSGKSTIGKLMSGILKLKNGRILIDDIDISKSRNIEEINNKIGIVFQNPENQIIFSNIYDEIAFSLQNLSKEEIEKRIEESLKKVEMLEAINKDLYTLSLGQKQRVMIAEVLARNPRYIILDEPTTMIDSLGKEKIYEIIKNLKKQGYTIICITNLADEILIADRTLILEDGKIVAEICKNELLQKVDILKKYKIKSPTILEIVARLKENGINIDIEDYNLEQLVNSLSRSFKV